MYSETISALLRAHPFVPFTIHISDGTTFKVPHVDFALLTPTGQTFYVAVHGEMVERINVAHVTRVSSESNVGIEH